MVEFNDKSRPKKDKKKKEILMKVYMLFMKVKNLNTFKSGIFPIKQKKVKDSKY